MTATTPQGVQTAQKAGWDRHVMIDVLMGLSFLWTVVNASVILAFRVVDVTWNAPIMENAKEINVFVTQ